MLELPLDRSTPPPGMRPPDPCVPSFHPDRQARRANEIKSANRKNRSDVVGAMPGTSFAKSGEEKLAKLRQDGWMPWLDCQTHESALETVAAAVEVPKDRLAAAIAAGEPDFSGTSKEDPIDSFPREILNGVGVELEQVELEGALLFHGTRLVDPKSVSRDGLQSLTQRLEAIWEMLGDLARPESGEADWLEFRNWVETGGGNHDGSLYRLKTRDALHDGPFTVLVRDTLVRPNELGLHDYLNCPEIVQDICRCHQAHFELDFGLEARFRAATDPCIITVRRRGVGSEAIGPAIWFIRAQLRGQPLNLCTAGGFPPKPIGPEDVLAVDVVGDVAA